MMQEKQVRLGVDDSKLKEVGGTTKKIYDDMIRSARSYTTSSKEVLRDLEEQIRLMEKRNKLEKDLAIQRAAPLKEFGGAKEQFQYANIVSGANASFKEGKMQVQLLRELIDTVKAAAKDEIKSNRDTVEKIVRKDKGLDRLGVTGDPEEALKRTLQREMLGELGEEEQTEKAKFKAFGKFGKGAEKASNVVAGVATSKNEIYAAAALLSMIPVVGQGLSQVANRLFSSAEGLGSSKERSAILNRKTIDQINKSDLLYEAKVVGELSGFNTKDVNDRWNLYKANAKRNLSFDERVNYIGAERMLGLSQGDIVNLMQSTRFGKSQDWYDIKTRKYTGTTNSEFVIARFQDIIDSQKKQQSLLPEMLNSFNMIAKTIGQSGFVNTATLSNNMASIYTKSGLEGEHFDRLTSSVQGLGNVQDPVSRSLLIRAFRRNNPNASLWEIQSMMESPFDHLKEVSSFFGDLEKQSGGKGSDMYRQVAYSLLKNSGTTRRDIDLFLKGDKSLSEILSPSELTTPENVNDWVSKKLSAGAESYASEMTKATKASDRFFEEYGDKAATIMYKSIEKLKSQVDKVFSIGDDQSIEKMKKEQYDNMKMAVSDGIADGFSRTKYNSWYGY